MVTFLRIVRVPGIVTIICMMANDHPKDGCHPWTCLENFDHLGEGNLPRDGHHPKNGDQNMGGDHHRDGGCLRDFYHPMGWLLNFGSVES